MNPFSRVRPLAFCLLIVVLFTTFGCKSAGGEGQSGAADISGPLKMLPDYQARAPRTCSKVTKPPSAALATVLVQCTMDALSDTGLGLIQDVKLEMGSPRAFVYWTDAGLDGIDLKADVYPLRGRYVGYFCRLISNMAPAGKSCVKSAVPVATGWCWKNSFGEWKCKLQGGAPAMEDAPAPKAF